MELIRLENTENEIFKKVVEWNYNWWGAPNNKSKEEVECTMAHSVNTDKLPQTFVAVENGEALGMYQISMSDDLAGRPDIYPWLINVYVDEKARGRNICRFMMETVKDKMKDANIAELYLYTNHVGLYEKFGWEFSEFVKIFKPGYEDERLYKLTL